MLARRILGSLSNDARLSAARDALHSIDTGAGVVVVAPTRGAADDFVRNSARGRPAVAGAHRFTLSSLAAELAAPASARAGLAPVGALGIEALAARSVDRCRKESPLAYFGPVDDTFGFGRALARTLTELRLCRVRPAEIAATGRPGTDLARLLTAYELSLAERSLADRATILRLAAEAVGTAERFTGCPLFLLDLDLRTVSERDFVGALSKRSPFVLATTLASDSDALRRLEELLGVSAEDLQAGETACPTASDGGAGIQPAAAHGPASLDRVRLGIFSTEPLATKPADTSVEMFSAAGEGLEAVEIARRVRALAAAGTCFDRIAVLLRNPDDYLPHLEDAFRRASIPAYFARGVTRPHAAGRAFLALLDCASDHLSASRFAEYLSLGQVPALDAASAPPVADAWAPPDEDLLPVVAAEDEAQVAEDSLDTDESDVLSGSLRAPIGWEKLIIDAAVIGGRERWSRRLDGLSEELRLQLAEAAEREPSRREHLARQIVRLDSLRRFALPLIALLDSLPGAAKWSRWLDLLAQLATAALRDPDPVLSVLAELESMDEVGPVALDEVRTVLSERLRFIRTPPPLRRYGMVFIGAIDHAAARSFDAVFLPGMVEGRFPFRITEDPLLLDEFRAALDARLPVRHDRIAAERALLRMAAGAARSRFVISYPRVDIAQGRQRVPSFYALEVLRAAEGRLPEIPELDSRAASSAPTRLGWPAPSDPGIAIDDTERDLAVLERLLLDTTENAKGHARYLLDANPILARSLRSRWQRWDKKWREADGLVRGDLLVSSGLRKRAYSASALQQFAVCPYRFFLYAIHQLRPRDEAAALEQMDPLTRGALFHKVQLEWFRAVRAQPQSRERLLDVADEVLNRVSAEFEQKLAPAIPRVWRDEIEALRSDVRGWVRQTAGDAWQPLHAEFAFGLPHSSERDPSSHPDPVPVLDGISLRGSMDLVEKHSQSGAFRITDHKTGKAPERVPAYTGGGEFLQPILYSLAAEKLFGATVESGRLFYCTQRGGYTEVTIPLDRLARNYVTVIANAVDQSLQAGFLPPAPKRGACELCDYRVVCGPYEEMRFSRKQADDRLDTLSEVRNQP